MIVVVIVVAEKVHNCRSKLTSLRFYCTHSVTNSFSLSISLNLSFLLVNAFLILSSDSFALQNWIGRVQELMLFLARVHDFEPIIKDTNIKAANSSEVRVGVDIALTEYKKMEVKQLHEEKSKKEKRKKKVI